MPKIPVESVWVSRAEGPTKDLGERTVSTLEAADAILKVDFKITWQDGESYDGRYDLQREDGTKKNLIGEHVQQFLTFHAGYWRPSHMTPEQYTTYLERVGFGEGSENRAMAKKLLEEYEL